MMAVTAAELPHVKDLFGVSPLSIQAVETRMLSLIRDATAPIDGVQPIAQQAAAYHLMSGGQRIRAQLAIQAGLALNLSVGDAVSIATAAELVHNASLIHDDLQDRDLTRHGAATVWAAYGDGVAICAGDLLLSAAFCALAGVSRPHLLPALISMLHRRIADASTGQCADLTNEKNRVFSVNDYEKLSALKSGALLALPIELALVAGGELQALPIARRAAESFAIGYQIFDDLNDVQTDAMRNSDQPAINAVAVMHAGNPNGDARALAGQLARKHLGVAVQSSLSLPHQCGQLLHQLALELTTRITMELT